MSTPSLLLDLEGLHAETGPSHALLRNGHLQDGIRKAAERLMNRVSELADHPDTRRRRGADLINRVFSEQNPILTFNPHESLDDWTMEDLDSHNGYRYLALGLTLAIRNVLTHADEHPLTDLEALEWMAFISAMHRRLDGAQQFVATPEAEASTGT